VSVIDDLAGRRDLPAVLDWCRAGRSIPVSRLRALVCESAGSVDVARYGEHWLRTLLDMLERAGVGHLARDRFGELALVPADELPTTGAAWQAITRSWGPPSSASV
jgi:hypothetical protein